jgi:glycosyltransferase involved in cell wall biosynthesis
LTDKLTISIVVRTQNRLHFLMQCLQSLYDQTRRPDEVIVVNDAGIPVDTVVAKFTGLNIHLIQNDTQQGRAISGNLGVKSACGDVIGFLDDDDRFLPDHLNHLEQAMLQSDDRVAYSGCRVVKRNIAGELNGVRESEVLEYNDPYDPSRLRYENYIPLINLLIDRSLWHEIHGFDESYDIFEDWDMLIRLSSHSQFYHLDQITTEYGLWDGQVTHTANRMEWTTAFKKILTLYISENQKLNSQLKQVSDSFSFRKSMGYFHLLDKIKKLIKQVVIKDSTPELLHSQPDTVAELNCENWIYPCNSYENVIRLKRNIRHVLLGLCNTGKNISNILPFNWWCKHLIATISERLERIVFKDEDMYHATSCFCKDVAFCAMTTPLSASIFSFSGTRPLSDIYPTFVSLAGVEDWVEIIDGDFRTGKIAFQLKPGCVLAFTTFCKLNNFSRVDILLSSDQRLFACRIRLVIYEIGRDQPVRISCVNGIDVVDNYPTTFRFDLIPDSAQKTYRLELDCPNRDEQPFLTVYCHPR